MFAKVTSLGVTGLAGYLVQVEADLSGGLPQFNLVGLPDSAVKESSERVRSAVKNLHYQWPASRITVNLAPAHVKKIGTLYDLPILVGILAAGEQLRLPAGGQAPLLENGAHGAVQKQKSVVKIKRAHSSFLLCTVDRSGSWSNSGTPAPGPSGAGRRRPQWR